MIQRLLLSFVLLVACGNIASASKYHSAEPGWTHGVILFGEAKKSKDATPILQRKYRPFHFYGNTVRRQYYRGNVYPTFSDLFQAVRVTITRK